MIRVNPIATTEDWCPGPLLAEARLRDEVLEIWTRAAALGPGSELVGSVPRDAVAAMAMMDAASRWLLDVLRSPGASRGGGTARRADAATLLVACERIAAEVREVALAIRVGAIARVQAAIGRLRSVGKLDQLTQIAPAELCNCGFDRAMLSRLDGSIASIEAIHSVNDPGWAAGMLTAYRTRPLRLDGLPFEAELVRRRAAAMVVDAQSDPRVNRALAQAVGTRSYVAAPIVLEGRVVGLVHADFHAQRRRVDEFDRDLLWMFAEGLGAAYERAVLLGRLRSLRHEVRSANHLIVASANESCEADIELGHIDRRHDSVARSVTSMAVTGASRLDSLLTPRELEVMKQMAAGATNAAIASRLVVSEGTVKSHIKHILRKLRASNRAEAVARFIKLSQSGGNALHGAE